MENKITKIALVGVASALVGGVVGAGMFPHEVEVEKEVIVTEVVEVPVEVVVNETVEVLVDNGNLEEVLDHLYDNDGDVEYLLEDLEDDEVEQIADRIVFVNDMKKLALDEVNAELFDQLDGEYVSRVELDERDMERLRIDDDSNEVKIESIDFDNEDIVLSVTGTFEQDDVEYEFEAEVEFKDGQYEDITSIQVSRN